MNTTRPMQSWNGCPRGLGQIPLCSHHKNFAHLCGMIDLARIARNPRRPHCLLGNTVEVLLADPDLPQAAGQAKATDETVEHVTGILAWVPIAAATIACRSALADLFQRITAGSMTQEV